MAKQRCEYNFQCEVKLPDGTYKNYSYKVKNPPYANHKVTIYDKEQEQEITYFTCDGCRDDLLSYCENDENYSLLEDCFL